MHKQIFSRIVRSFARGSALAFALMVSACSTPPIVLTQANHTVILLTNLGGQLEQFRIVQGAASAARIKSLEIQSNSLKKIRAGATIDRLSSKAASTDVPEPFSQKVQAYAEAFAGGLAKGDAANYSANLKTLLLPLPDISTGIAQVQVKTALMGQELDKSIRYTELIELAQEIAQGIVEGRTKIIDARKAAESADVSAGKAAAAPAEATAGDATQNK